MKEFAREHLASYKVPRSISWLDELPKTGRARSSSANSASPSGPGRTSNV